MRVGHALLALSLIAVSALGTETRAAPFSEEADRWGSARRIVEPKHPGVLLAEGQLVHVEFDGIVNGVGALEDIRFRAVDAATEPFVAVLRDVLPHWKYWPHQGNDCMPMKVRSGTRATWQMKEGRPHFSVTHAREEPRTLLPDERPDRRYRPRYPVGPLHDDKEAVVFARIVIGADGLVDGVAAKAYPEDRDSRAFEKAVREALSRWLYPEASPERKTAREACYTIEFRISP